MTMHMTAQTAARVRAPAREAEATWRWPLPAGTLLAVFEDRRAAFAAASDLEDSASTVAYGRLMAEEVGAGRGRQWLGNERDITEQLAAALSAGRAVLLARSGSRGALDALQSHGAASIYRVGRWTTERIASRRT